MTLEHGLHGKHKTMGPHRGDPLAGNPIAQLKRNAIHAHNACMGSARFMEVQANAMATRPTLTFEARLLA